MVWYNNRNASRIHYWFSTLYVCNFADDNTLHSCNKNLSVIFQDWVYDLKNVLNRFRINSLKANPKKFQFMVLGRSISDSYVLNIDAMEITSTTEVTLLGIFVDNKFTFKNHINELCRKPSCKLHTLHRIRHFLIKKRSQVTCKRFY